MYKIVDVDPIPSLRADLLPVKYICSQATQQYPAHFSQSRILYYTQISVLNNFKIKIKMQEGRRNVYH